MLALEPLIPVPFKALLPAGKLSSITVMAFMRCFQQALTFANKRV